MERENQEPFFELRVGSWHSKLQKFPEWPAKAGKKISVGIGIGIGGSAGLQIFALLSEHFDLIR
ncbi:hypothetical protein ABT143_17380 [Streptomyces sp. NPDC002033]|uniref:hypothetical protein n=1 Tax=unclassified Streptomyces TaxID=2593676 RepID=UPI003317A6FE